jgi:serine/threonine-protein kinase HipA
VLFNTLIGNNDAHAKNYSLIYGAGGTTLAPLYDVLCTAVYPELTPRMAMKIGDHYKFSDIFPRHWERFAQGANLSPPQVRRRLLDLTQRLLQAAHELRDDFADRGQATPLIDRIIETIEHRCGLTRVRFEKTQAASGS